MKKGSTIGMDLGDKKHQVCILDPAGKIIAEKEVAGNRTAMASFFKQYCGAVVAMEAGTHSRWVSQIAAAAGLEVLVGNARKLRMIWQSRQKSDTRDAVMLARIARFDPALLCPIRHRGEQVQMDLEIIRARDLLVQERARMIHHVRGVVKSMGERLAASSTASFGHKAKIPEALNEALKPMLEMIRELTEKIREYDLMIKKTAANKYPETEQLRQVGGVGPLTALAYVLTLEDPGRFAKSRTVGAYLGLVPRLDQSGQIDKQLRITKHGDGYLRRLLVGSAHYILGPFGPDCDLRTFGRKLMQRGGKNAKKRAVVAMARKLAVLLHALWRSGSIYEPKRNQPLAA
ncbi:MAG: IS110 family transposase [Lentisphaerae bacterium]|nr:IS110 family transposase [Lentisphaerota bacterium]